MTQLNRKLPLGIQDFEEMRLRLKANAEEKVAYDKENKELISNISHDLKTPITVIQGYAKAVADGLTDEEMQKQYLNLPGQTRL